MNDSPQVQPLPYHHRAWFFRFLLSIFILSVPIFIFYSMGYRVDIFENPGNIVTVGGMFVSSDTETDTQIYVNEVLIDNYRLFQKSAYIQSLPAGVHRVHVQGEGLQTWIKELPVYSHIVTESNAFNLPLIPNIRVVTPYTTFDGKAVVVSATSSMPATSSVEYRNIWIATTTKSTTTLQRNTEYDYLFARFASSTKSETLLSRITTELEQFSFVGSTATTATTTEVEATTTISVRDRSVQEIDGGLLVTWLGSESSIPYYFCVPYNNASSTKSVYDSQTLLDIAAVYASLEEPLPIGGRTCRHSIRIGGDYQELYSFDFYPSDHDLLILHRSDGVVVKEIDDRSWQNTQVLYPAGDYEFLIDGSRFFIKQGPIIFELLTTLK